MTGSLDAEVHPLYTASLLAAGPAERPVKKV